MSPFKFLTIKSSRAPLALYILNGIALFGIGTSIALSQHYYSVRNGTSGFKSFCNVSETMNCDLVAASPFADLIGGLPLSSFSAGWFLSLFIIGLIAHNRLWRREAIRACAALSSLGTLIAAIYLVIMVTQLKTYCVLCLAIDVLNVGALLTAIALRPEGFAEHKLNPVQWKILGPTVLASILVSVFALKITLDPAEYSRSEISEAAQAVLQTPPISVNAGEEFPSIGPKNARVTIVEFSDFQCPFCRMAAFTVNSVLNRYRDQVRIVFRNFPLDQACNPSLPATAHPIACEAARVALCANKQGKFERIYEELFEQQSSFTPGRPLELARTLGLDMNPLQGCIESPEIASAIGRDIEEGKLLGIKSTPTFFINGHRLEGASPTPVWNQVIEQLLAHP